ncbi:MAG TPA: right-handed parallel beta-helix repeat-containing protein [Nitrososphaera sp.]|nr:right-handed parallel beta-helix repeat-containing protein [Nitrososphaera sp.]
MRAFAAIAFTFMLLIPLAAAQLAGPESRGPRSEVIFGTDPRYVALTFYFDNATRMQEITGILGDKNVTDAVFFVDPAIARTNSSTIDTAIQMGYNIFNWTDKSAYDSRYPPSQFNNITLSDRSVLGRTSKMADVAAFYGLALHSANSSIIAFTPPIPPRVNYSTSIDMLEELLDSKARTVVYSSEPASNPSRLSMIEPVPDTESVTAIGANTTSSIVIDSGSWNMTRLQGRYPADIAILSGQNGIAYLVDTSVIVEEDAQLEISDSVVWIASPPNDDKDRRIEVKGNLTISDSSVSSWDSLIESPDYNPYHQRPFIFIDEGLFVMTNSTITNMGFLVGGFSESRTARAAVTIHESDNFAVTNSTLAFNFDALYARNSSFTVAGSEIFGNTRSGIDIRSGSRDLAVTGNQVHDNGYEGIICIECTRAIISGNVVEHNKEAGIKLISSNFTGIRDNEVRYNEKFGIFLRDNSTQNVLQSNTIVESREGIALAGNSSNNFLLENMLLQNDEAIDIDTSSQPNQQRNNRVTD